ncbi:MAG: preprotein translocase subunit YajC [Candidatus Eisenbacteria bacterium]|nr:preprotein translocase subunit YajC [Candidatus Eisenbacteria bacterium]
MTGGGAEGQGGSWSPLILLVLMFAVFYFLIIRPQQKRQRQHQKMLAAVDNGDRVLTSGGLIGNVVGTKEVEGVAILVLKIAENTKVEVSRTHIQQVLEKNR